MSEESTSGAGDLNHGSSSNDVLTQDSTADANVDNDALLGARPRPMPRSTVGRALRARSNRRLRARRVRRLVRHVEPWSVLKVSLILYFCAWVVMLFVGVTLWNLAVNSGLVSNIENFVVELFALESFQINADQIFRIAAVGGLVLVLGGQRADSARCSVVQSDQRCHRGSASDRY